MTPRMRTSIRLRLTLWNASVLAMVLIAFANGGFLTLTAVLRERGDASVSQSARAIAGAVSAERRAARDRGDVTRVRGEAARAALRELRTRDLDVFIADEAARVLAASRGPARPRSAAPTRAGMARVPVPAPPVAPADPDTLAMPAAVRDLLRQSVKPGEVVLRTVRIDDLDWRAALIRVPAGQDYAEAPAFIVGVLRSGEDDLAVLGRVRTTLLFAIPLALLVSVITGYAIARRSLAPMDEMAARAARISAATLNERLPVGNSHDELGRLATVINDLLGRVDVAFRKQKQFVADASHELRTPIAIVRGEADVTLQRPVREESEYREALAVIRDESVRLTRIVDDLFLLARTDAGSPLDRRERVDIADLLAAGLRSVRTIADTRGILLDSSIAAEPTHPAFVMGDRALLRRLLLNLLDNALKNTPRNGCITVSLTSTESDVFFVVADNGLGIAAELRPRIFDRFVRAEVAAPGPLGEGPQHELGTVAVDTVPSASGAGLGLAIAQAIAHAHDGEITLDDVFAGASFRVTLPRDRG